MKIYTGETEELRIFTILSAAEKENAIVLCAEEDFLKFTTTKSFHSKDVEIKVFSLCELMDLQQDKEKYIIDKFEMLFPIALSGMVGYGSIFDFNTENKKGDNNVN